MVADGGATPGSLVWVQRKNGTWWPGRVVDPTEISPLHNLSSSSSSSSSACKTPIMLLGKDNYSVDWYNFEKSKRIKPFRCGEFEDCIKQAESSQASTTNAENLKYARRQDAILHALALEKKEQQKNLKRAGDVVVKTNCRAKRSRCTYLPIQSQSSKVSTSRTETDDSTFVSGVAVENTATMETESQSPFSKDGSRDSLKNRVLHASGHSQRQLRSTKSKSPKNQTLKVKFKLRGSPSTNGKRSVMKNSAREITLISSSQEIANSFEARSGENVDQELPHLTLGGSSLDDSDTVSIGSANTIRQNGMQMTLIDVNLTVQQSYRGEHVPFICLVSRMSEKAIIGHPIDIEVLHDSSEIIPPRKDREDDRNRVLQLVWKTSKRTPVCYISDPQSGPAIKNGRSAPASQSFTDLKAKRNGFSAESAGRSFNKHNFLNGKALADSIKRKGSGNVGQRDTCVTVAHIFSKLLEAVEKH